LVLDAAWGKRTISVPSGAEHLASVPEIPKTSTLQKNYEWKEKVPPANVDTKS